VSINERQHYQLHLLLVRCFDGIISEEEFSVLDKLLKTSADARHYYYRFIILNYGLKEENLWLLKERVSASQAAHEECLDGQFWKLLSENEKLAPVIHVPKTQAASEEGIETTSAIHVPRKVGKWSILSIVMSAAAMLLLFLFAYYVPPKGGTEVATISDSVNAKWADSSTPTGVGSRLLDTDPSLMLREGYVKLLFDNQARVVIEGPAEFQILTSDQIKLNYGRLYSIVPEQAYGFTVSTPTSKIIDLGTEFGVQCDPYGNLELHVLKGKTNLISNAKAAKINLFVTEGIAKKMSGSTKQVSDVSLQETLFVRNINSESQVIWKGQKTIDLADIVGGGNGLGTGKRGSYIDVSSGQWKPVSEIADQPKELAKRASTYAPVASNKYVDGVFIPDGENESVRVTSQGHVFNDLPNTTGTNWGGVINVEQVMRRQIVLNDVVYGTPERSALFMHANAGITFDLDMIRQAFPGQEITAFKAVYGISDTYPDVGRKACADFWVLVDGQLKSVQRNIIVHEGGTLEIPLSGSDRYLTLITTDAADESGEARESYNDWCVFGEPRLYVR
jgi:hypothetical protein